MKRERDEEILLCCKNDLPLDEDDYKINRNKYLPDLILAVECLKEAGLGKRHRNFADKILQEHQFYQQGKKRKPEFLDVWIESCQSK